MQFPNAYKGVKKIYLGELLIFNIILKGLPLCLLGIWLYWRRELALAMKQ